MTKEIKKAIALEVAKAFITELTKFGGDYPESAGTNIVLDAYKALREIEQALNPEPKKPTNQELINWLGKLHYSTDESRANCQHLVELLQEPQPNKWIKNTGVAPEGKEIVAKLRNGNLIEVLDIGDYDYDWRLEDHSLDVTHYMIIEE